MARPLPASNLEAVAAWLAEEERKKQAQQAAHESPLTQDYYAATVRPYGSGPLHAIRKAVGVDPAYAIDTVRLSPGMKSELRTTSGWDGTDPRPIQGLREGGAKVVPPAVFEGMQEQAALLAPGGNQPPGKLPFISGVPTHKAQPTPLSQLPNVADPDMAEAMANAAAVQRSGAAPVTPPPSTRPAPASAKRSRSVQVALTSQTGAQPELRTPTARPYGSPPAGDRFRGLPPSVATFLQQRSGLADAQADANRRGLAVELASAFNQVGAGISGSRYDDSAWANQRAAAGQPVEDFRLRSEEERSVAADQRAAEEAARAAELELQKFQYGQQRDKDEAQLERERLQLQKDIAEGRLRSEALDRGLRRQEMSARQSATQAEINERARLNRELRQQQTNERDLQKLAERAQPVSEMVEDITYLNSVIREGGRSFDAIPGVGPIAGHMPEVFRSTEGDKVAQAVNRLASNIILAKSGKAATDAERRFLLDSYGIRPGTTESAWTEGIKALVRDAAVAMRNIESGFRPEVVSERATRGGTTSADIPAPVSFSTGEEIEMPDGSVYEVLEDGTTRRVR